ncbi:lysophospholipid acyltransferase family protein [Pseudaminobacter sp. 19-2017]|uniref:Lysophospholipid acyltransferase family protein n=1 Tax=Pseudaminobacter soli (ex Zhang et al. 2022) TaxID=2831468 RepID=A0A942I196_9HYPH|nr:lysophospholipid acyltransferase family protein [Pseudaminobacter soli]MBS3647387.1 lysophospholipid acyltransferase family protein [Pseudaminobacter soli]
MSDIPVSQLGAAAPAKKKKPRRPAGPLKAFWRRIRQPLAESRFAKGAIATLLAHALRFIRLTNPAAEGSTDLNKAHEALTPAILALWHGQHLLAPTVYTHGEEIIAMVSRSADAELNALVLEKFGFKTVRGSGGRGEKRASKGGAQALVAMKKALDAGTNVCMIADIPHGTPRQAGMGIVTLARLSGRPIVPLAIATSRRKVLERSWDKTTINLPFGRSAVIVGESVLVPADASEAELEAKRQEVTARLNEATEQAYRIADQRR